MVVVLLFSDFRFLVSFVVGKKKKNLRGDPTTSLAAFFVCRPDYIVIYTVSKLRYHSRLPQKNGVSYKQNTTYN